MDRHFKVVQILVSFFAGLKWRLRDLLQLRVLGARFDLLQNGSLFVFDLHFNFMADTDCNIIKSKNNGKSTKGKH